MKRLITISLVLLFVILQLALSAPGDRTIVRTIDFQQRRIGWYQFPDQGKKYHQILMHYKLRCPPGKPCGEWDYISYVFMNQWYAPNFRADRKVYDTFSFMKDTSWSYTQVDVGGQKVIKKTPKSHVVIEFYNDSKNPTKATDSLVVWPTYFSDYKFDANGKATDSAAVAPDSTLKLTKKRVYYDDNVTFNDRWEIFRYITPYGNGLNLWDGVTWTFDVTDFAPVLTGLVHLASPNGGWGDSYDQNSQEDLELTFEFIEGTPPREVKNITKLWDFYGITYDKNFENQVGEYEYNFSSDEKTAMMRVTQSGHGFGGTADNCAEFCRKLGMAKVDGQKRYEQYVWRECGDNAIYPQGGTWIYDRSNWCPGAEVKPYDYEITPFISPGSSHTIDYDMEYYDLNWAGGSNTKPNWVLTGYLFTYGDVTHTIDARISEIIQPNSDKIYNRFNPSCGNPVIKIQNSGKNPITKIKIAYGNNPDNLVTTEVDLDKPVDFMKESEIELPNNNFYDKNSPNTFYAKVIEVNGKSDEYSPNNSKSVVFDPEVPEYFSNFVIELKTPNSNVLQINSPIQYYLTDIDGNILYSRSTTENSKEYKDTVNLANGCYRVTIVNTQGFGLGFWAYQQYGLINGSFRFTINGSTIKQFPTDWGSYYSHEFKIGSQPSIVVDVVGDTLNFGDVVLGNQATRKIEISSANEKGIKIENMNIVLGNSKKFEILQTEPKAVNGMYNLKFGEKLIVTVGFNPVSDGFKTAPLRITSNDFLNWQKTIILNGRGRDPLSISDNRSDINDLDILVDFNSRAEEIIVTVNTNSIGGNGVISLYDYLGNRVINSENLNINDYASRTTLDASKLSSGVYFIKFEYNGNQVNSKLMIAR